MFKRNACRWLCSLVFLIPLAFSFAAGAQTLDVPNPSFEAGTAQPQGWTLSGGDGQWLDNDAADGARAVSVTGTGATETTNCWQSPPISGLQPSSVYCITFKARTLKATRGSIVSGPAFCNRDIGTLSASWQEVRSIFVTPDAITPEQAYLRFGQWELDGTAQFDAVSLMPAQPAYAIAGGFTLGEGERVEGNAYSFTAPLEGESRNHSRPLHHYRAGFNTHRWVLTETSEVVCRHHIGGRGQSRARLEVTGANWGGGTLTAEASRDGATWTSIGSIDKPGLLACDIDPALLPAAEIWIRLSVRPVSPATSASCQIIGYSYRATLDGPPASLMGATRFICVPAEDPRLKIVLDSLGEGIPGGANVLTASIENLTDAPIAARPALTFVRPDAAPRAFASEMTLKKGVTTLALPYDVPGVSGAYTMRIDLGPDIAWKAETALRVPILFDSSYGALVPGSTPDVALWAASSGWKVSQTRPVPVNKQEAITIRTARNEAEAAQLVVRPAAALQGFTAEAGALNGPNGAVIAPDRIDILRVRHIAVTRPTDETGVVASWPDPLPPFREPITVAAQCNQPLWVRVTPPRDVPAGVYSGVIILRANGYQAEVPLRVEVYDFDLPDRMTCTTAFGFDASLIFRYHNVTEPAQRRVLMDKYLANYGAHHIAPYNPAPLDSFGVTWPSGDGWAGGIHTSGDKHAGERSLLLDDDNPHGDVSALYEKTIPIVPGGMRLRFWYKTREPGQALLATWQHIDANGAWMSGRNHDEPVVGDGTWQQADLAMTAFPEGAAAIRLALRPALYSEDGATTGAAWFDDLSLTALEDGGELLRADFEPVSALDLTPQFDWTTWDAAVAHARDTYHFNGLCVPIQGLGGGTFFSRTEPTLCGYDENTPEYRAMFNAYCGALEQHLREKGWLEDSYVYWFDEPEPRDYEFVMNGFRKLKNAAPGIGRMLTEQVDPELVGGPNIWCPLSPAFDAEKAAARQADGDRIWWYICTGPKAPYCTLFIDHAGTELRTWLWQTWQRGIQGILIWQTNYWTSDEAYPEFSRPQDPYTDPMGWVTGYGYKPGERLPWGNGDGRFVYPPEAAADGTPSEPVLEGPVDSIRWEMLRDGIEDYEYCVILKRLLTEKSRAISAEQRARHEELLRVPEAITRDLTTFATDPEPIETRRHEIARAIEDLGK